ncbi:hypothetical protein EYR36_006175 [Pleurotus pulmonarius]|nr:hypothetical protein EYR36_006175 [Pleurotus pulmonarius]KAF4600883.1 hypothetical protein EYR38_005528 [Pleurotus pulmonarius]
MSLGSLGGILGLGPLVDPQPAGVPRTTSLAATPLFSPGPIRTEAPTRVPASSPTLIRAQRTFTPTQRPSSSSTIATPSQSLSTVLFESYSDGQIKTITTFMPASTETAGIPAIVNTRTSGNNGQPTGFLQNKSLSGFVFFILGVTLLALISVVITCVMRRRQRRKRMNEAMAFDAASMIVDPYNRNHTNSPQEDIFGESLSRSSSSRSGRSKKHMSEESYGYAGYGTYAGGDYTAHGVPTLAYTAPSAAFHPQFPHPTHIDRQKTYEQKAYY